MNSITIVVVFFSFFFYQSNSPRHLRPGFRVPRPYTNDIVTVVISPLGLPVDGQNIIIIIFFTIIVALFLYGIEKTIRRKTAVRRPSFPPPLPAGFGHTRFYLFALDRRRTNIEHHPRYGFEQSNTTPTPTILPSPHKS